MAQAPKRRNLHSPDRLHIPPTRIRRGGSDRERRLGNGNGPRRTSDIRRRSTAILLLRSRRTTLPQRSTLTLQMGESRNGVLVRDGERVVCERDGRWRGLVFVAAGAVGTGRTGDPFAADQARACRACAVDLVPGSVGIAVRSVARCGGEYVEEVERGDVVLLWG